MSDKQTTTTTVRRGSQRTVLAPAHGKRIRRDGSYTIAEAAQLVGTSTAAVLRWVNLGYVAATKEPTGNGTRTSYRVAGGDLADFLKGRAKAAKTKA